MPSTQMPPESLPPAAGATVEAMGLGHSLMFSPWHRISTKLYCAVCSTCGATLWVTQRSDGTWYAGGTSLLDWCHDA